MLLEITLSLTILSLLLNLVMLWKLITIECDTAVTESYLTRLKYYAFDEPYNQMYERALNDIAIEVQHQNCKRQACNYTEKSSENTANKFGWNTAR